MRRLWVLLLGLGTLLSARAARAQGPDSTLALAVRAYQSLDFELASAFLRRLVAAPTFAARSLAERERVLTYLGASQWYGRQRDSATVVFRTLVLLDPRYRPSDLLFPPEITTAFAEVRRTIKVVAISASPDTTIQVGEGYFAARVVASSPHDVTGALLREDGSTLRTLYTGPIGDSLDIRWDGLDSSGSAVGGSFALSVTSRLPDGHPLRMARVRVDVTLVPLDTLALPPPIADSQFLPERVPGHRPASALLGGLADALLIAALPSVVAAGSHPSGARFAVAAGVGVAALASFFIHRGTRTLPANIAANENLRASWQHRVDATKAENGRRRRTPKLLVRASPRTLIELESP